MFEAQNTWIHISMPLVKDYLCSLLNLDLAGPRNSKIIRCLRIMIFINGFVLIAFGNIGFYFETNEDDQRIVVPWQVLLVFKILVTMSGGFQLISLPFFDYMEKIFNEKTSRISWRARNGEAKKWRCAFPGYGTRTQPY